MKKDRRPIGYSLRMIGRCMAFLEKYWPMVAGAYAIVLASNGINIYMPLLIRKIIDQGIRGGVMEIIVRGTALLFGLALIQGIFTYLSGIWTEKASQGVAYELRNRIHAKLQSLSFGYHDKSESGQLLTRAVSDVDRVRFLTGRAVLRFAEMLLLILGVAAAMLAVNARLALASFVILPPLTFVAFRFGAKVRPLSRRIQQQEGVMTTALDQNLRGSRIVRAFGREDREIAVFDRENRTLFDLNLKNARIRAVYLPFMEFATGFGTIIVLVYGGSLVIGETLTIGELVAFTTYLTMLLGPVRRFGWVGAAIAQAVASAERIFEILDASSDVVEAPDALEIGDIEGRIQFDHVGFSYFNGETVLEDIHFTVESGEIIALLGMTGSGKSSIINLIPRFYDVTSGTIRIDGHDIRRLTLASLRQNIGIVLQDTTLFASTIRENIAFGRPGATDDEIRSAAKAAHAAEFIESFTDGYETYVGERGVTLSGGQKQRIAIARALANDPRILILDDATSSVDTETEALIQQALERLMQGRTSIVIAQRLSTVRKADKILVLEDGKIAAYADRAVHGPPHEELLRSSPLYAEIYNLQLKPAEIGIGGSSC